MVGKTLGSYRLDAELGSGAMGKVYRATGPAGTVAVKVVHPHLLESPGFFKRFLREAELGMSVVHPNVVRTLDCDALGADHFLVMEYVEGQTLRGLLEELARVPEELCRHIGREMAKGLGAIHAAGAVHRDLKPENVLITQDHAVKIMDLGVARLADETLRLSRSGAFVGSVQYASPEQFGGTGEDLDGRSDLYSLGVILYELSCGEHPHPGDSFGAVLAKVVMEEPRRLGERNPQLSPFFEEVVHTLLAKDRASRFPTGPALSVVLEEGEGSAWWAERARAIRAETKRPLRRVRIPRETAVYGRDAEIAALASLYEAVRGGDGRVVLVEGEAGIGKTRLVDELVGGLRAQGEEANFLFGSYPPGGAATAAGAWSTAFREQFGSEGLEETLARYLTITPVLIPAFAALLRGEPPPTGSAPLDKDSIHAVFVHATRALAKERPTIVLIEDLHFAPEEGRALFAALALAVPDHRILLVGTSRPGLPENWRANLARLPQVSRVDLPRLGPKDLARLLTDAFHSDRLADELGMQIARKSDGNPFFVFEIIRGLREGRFITRRDDGTWATTKAIREIEVPSSVQDLVAARIADLDDTEREILDVAACSGFAFDPRLVAEVAGQPLIPTLRRFAHLEQNHRLVRSAGDRFVFDHHQVHETIRSRLPPPLAREYHAAIGEALERHGPPSRSVAVEVCEHYLDGGRGERALPWLGAALDHLEKGYLTGPYVSLADRALAVPGLLAGAARVKCLLDLAGANRPLGRMGRRERQQAACEEALALAVQIGDRSGEMEATGNLGLLSYLFGRHDDACRHFERQLALAREIGDRRGEVNATGNLGNVCWTLGRYDEALERHGWALAVAREAGDRPGEANATGNLGNVLWSLARYDEARAHYERQLAMTREIGDRRGEATATGNLGIMFLSLGRHEEARDHLERSLATCREIGFRRGEALFTGSLGNVLLGFGRCTAARERFERHLAIAREIGERQGEGWARGNLGNLSLAFGRRAEARAHFEQQLAISREIGDRSAEACALSNLGSLAEAEGDEVEARRRYGEALAIHRALGEPGGAVEALVALAELDRERGDAEGAVARAEEALALARESQVADAVLPAAVCRARLPGGDPAAALAEFFGIGERLPHRARMEAGFALFGITGDRAHLVEAKRLLDLLVEHAPEDCRESMLRNVRLHREIATAAEEAGLREREQKSPACRTGTGRE
ncbi:MAG: tetratricopeptide repeat protein [Planctomycetes bacterium]|nr:tetratricopeptide repeat protein [Planctomycetota bacterium]